MTAPACKPSFCVSKSSAWRGLGFPERPDKFQMELFLLVGQIAQETKMTFSTHPPAGVLLRLPPSPCAGSTGADAALPLMGASSASLQICLL